MGLALRMLLVDPSDRIHRFGIAKFDEMRRNPARHRYSQFAGQRVRTVEAVVQLVDRKPTRVVRMTFDIFTIGVFHTRNANGFRIAAMVSSTI